MTPPATPLTRLALNACGSAQQAHIAHECETTAEPGPGNSGRLLNLLNGRTVKCPPCAGSLRRQLLELRTSCTTDVPSAAASTRCVGDEPSRWQRSVGTAAANEIRLASVVPRETPTCTTQGSVSQHATRSSRGSRSHTRDASDTTGSPPVPECGQPGRQPSHRSGISRAPSPARHA